jgi:transposase
MISIEIREIISKANKRGIKVKEISRLLDIGERTIRNLLKHERETGSMAPLPHKGRKPALDACGLERLKALLEEKKDITLEEIEKEMGLTIDISALSRIIHHKLGYNYKKKPSCQRAGQTGKQEKEG